MQTKNKPGDEIQYRWFSVGGDWKDFDKDDKGNFTIDLRQAETLSGKIFVSAGAWPDASLTKE